MEVTISYDIDQLEAAVTFVAEHNKVAMGDRDYIRARIIELMREIARDPERWSSATMGFLITCDKEFEGLDVDENTARFEIWVDPSLGMDYVNIKTEVIQ